MNRIKVTSSLLKGSKPSFHHTLFFNSAKDLHAYYATLLSLGYVYDDVFKAYIFDMGDKMHFVYVD